jgi:hypothetical protein
LAGVNFGGDFLGFAGLSLLVTFRAVSLSFFFASRFRGLLNLPGFVAKIRLVRGAIAFS